ncbi:MAG: azurin [Bacteroidia bacterium]|nr:azurin [Bacteroidia bacterium]
MRTLKLAFILTLSLVMISCGGDKKKEEKEKVKIGTKKQSTSTSSDKEIDVKITGNDQMQFNVKVIRVKEGQEVTVTLQHVGKMAVNIMGHNFVLLKQGTDINTFGSEASAAKEADYIPNDGKDVIAHTKMIGGGDTTSVTFMAPAKGEYDFICSFPGHYALMQGKFIVE